MCVEFVFSDYDVINEVQGVPGSDGFSSDGFATDGFLVGFSPLFPRHDSHKPWFSIRQRN